MNISKRFSPLIALFISLFLAILSAGCAGTSTYTSPSRDLGVCFHEFTEVLEKRIWPVMNNAPGVTDIRRADILCAGESRCLCYELYYTGPLEELESYLRQNLRTSKVVPFRIVQKGDNRLDLYFDAGFK